MRISSAVLLVGLVGCGGVPQPSSSSDGGPAGAPDSGFTSAALSFAGEIQPLLWQKCANCHDGDAGHRAFVNSHAALLSPSTLCPGDRVGECVAQALQAQIPEGAGCRTIVVRPFHREGWKCLTAGEIERVVGWVDAGMPEH